MAFKIILDVYGYTVVIALALFCLSVVIPVNERNENAQRLFAEIFFVTKRILRWAIAMAPFLLAWGQFIPTNHVILWHDLAAIPVTLLSVLAFILGFDWLIEHS